MVTDLPGGYIIFNGNGDDRQMNRCFKILGNGQIWDVKGILSSAPQKTFEDLFSGRALGQMAREFDQSLPPDKKIFSNFKENSKITGLSVTNALLSKDKNAAGKALVLLRQLAKNAAKGIEVLTKGKGCKPDWPNKERNYWKNLDVIIIGGGVSENTTGKVLVELIKIYLSNRGLQDIKIYQAKFPGKEAGFLGAVANIRGLVCKEAKKKKLRKISAIGIDLGRDEIGVGLMAINLNGENIILRRGTYHGLFQHSVKTPYHFQRKGFLDSRKSYSKKEYAMGKDIRRLILEKIADLIVLAQAKATDAGLQVSRHIAVSVPGSTSNGYIVNSTDYLPFFRKKDGFNFSHTLKGLLVRKGIKGYHVHIINDGIAAGIANVYFAPFKTKGEKFAFFGVGSGLAGCVGLF